MFGFCFTEWLQYHKLTVLSANKSADNSLCFVQEGSGGQEKLEKLLCEQFLQGFEICHAFLRPKLVGEKRRKIQNPVKIIQKAVFLIFVSLF